MRLTAYILLIALLAVASGCTTPAPPGTAAATALEEAPPVTLETVRGEITYRARIALVPGSTATVTLSDVSRMDAPATVIASDDILIESQQVPLPFELSYEAGALPANGRYTVRGTISDPGGKLLWTTDTSNPVTPGNGDTDLGMLVLVSAAPARPPAPQPALTGAEWIVEDVNRTGIIDASHISMAFGTDGRVTGLASCNNYTGSYTQDGSALTVGPLAMTRKMCPEALMNQEMKFTGILARVTGFSFDETGALVLLTGEGETLTARR
ncbi:MAG: YbaY family lipoprotein [Hyphomonas sp.]